MGSDSVREFFRTPAQTARTHHQTGGWTVADGGRTVARQCHRQETIHCFRPVQRVILRIKRS